MLKRRTIFISLKNCALNRNYDRYNYSEEISKFRSICERIIALVTKANVIFNFPIEPASFLSSSQSAPYYTSRGMENVDSEGK